MRACRLNPNKKNLAESGGYNTAYDLSQRLKDRYHKLDEVATSTHLMDYLMETSPVRSSSIASSVHAFIFVKWTSI